MKWHMRLAVLLLFSAGAVCGDEATAEVCPEVCVAEAEAPPAVDTMIFDLGGHDAMEGFNRSMFEVNNVFMRWIYRPVGMFYGSIMPRFGVNMVNNFADNVAFLPRMFSSFGQAKWKGGGTEFLRFLTNTTVGIGGLFDPATHWFGLERQDEDFGQMFAAWGIPGGAGLMLPGMGQTNLRDGFGSIFDYALDPKTYINGAQAIAMLHKGLDVYPAYEKLRWSSADSYWFYRLYALMRREMQLRDWDVRDSFALYAAQMAAAAEAADEGGEVFDADVVRLSDAVWQSPVIDTLKVQWFRPEAYDQSWWVNISPWNSDFDNLYRIREVQIDPVTRPDRPALGYRYWRPKDGNDDAPLAVLIPGLGGHFMGGMTVPLAELYHQRGWAVAVISNPFNWEFASAALPGGLPGFTPVDAEAVRFAVARILEDLALDEVLFPEEIALVGYSQGALYTLHAAAQERVTPTLPVSRYIAINPPVDMLHGLTTLDAYYQAGARWEPQEALDRVIEGFGVYMAAAEMPIDNMSVIPLDEETAQFMIGFSYRLTLTELLAAVHKRNPLPPVETPYAWSDRNALYRELGRYDFRWYAENVLLPYYNTRLGLDMTLEELNAQSGLLAIAEALKGETRVSILTNRDDFLLTPEDRNFLRDCLGERLILFAHGGHMGNLYHPQVKERLRQEIPDYSPAPEIPLEEAQAEE